MNTDMSVEDQIASCLTPGTQGSFILKAGAGSGKTQTLVKSVRSAFEAQGTSLALTGARIAVITYTRAARDEIRKRLEFDPRVTVSTIHSFAWELIRNHPAAIKALRDAHIRRRIEELESKESKGRPGAASIERKRKIARYHELLKHLPDVKVFQYSPDTDIPAYGELNHHEVLEVFAELLQTKPLLGNILVGRYPVLFIDEVQDTSKLIIPALMHVEAEHHGRFTLGFFGDMMQRIYLDGVEDLPSLVPSRWLTPTINGNHRSGSRIVQLANAIRSSADGEVQTPQLTREGYVRLFIADASRNRTEVENSVREKMARVTSDESWKTDRHGTGSDEVKTLVLEHTLAASRLGFKEFSDCFVNRGVKDSLYGQGAATDSLTSYIGDIVEVCSAIVDGELWKADNLLAVLRDGSLRFRATGIQAPAQESAFPDFAASQASARELMDLILSEKRVTLFDIVSHIRRTQLFDLHPQLIDFLEVHEDDAASPADSESRNSEAWRAGLQLTWQQFQNYYSYVLGRAAIDTHQGVKGLEFGHVMLILDDSEARGNLFSYDKLLGQRELSASDDSNILSKKETSVDRTRRLLYVACTRAVESLAIVHYIEPSKLSDTSGMTSLFLAEEIETIP